MFFKDVSLILTLKTTTKSRLFLPEVVWSMVTTTISIAKQHIANEQTILSQSYYYSEMEQ